MANTFKNYNVLKKVNNPSDLKKLSLSDMKKLCAEIRGFLLDNVSRSGGHLASNLGVVELTCALHYCFDVPKDKIVWDVGHQSYVHKILTGRKDGFDNLRQKGGLSGFTKISESKYDSFGAGHASTSVSAALGLAVARELTGGTGKVIAVIGDGAMTGGLAFEGLNNAGARKRDIGGMIVIINDNEMSISKNVGALSKHLNELRTAPVYLGAKEDIRVMLDKVPRGEVIAKIITKTKEKIKYLLVPGIIFEEMGFSYYGPVDGHDIKALTRVLSKIKHVDEPVVLHVYTKKGKGYRLAEDNPNKFHGAPAFDTSTGNEKKAKIDNFTDVFSKKMLELGAKNKKLVAITAAMEDGCGLGAFAKQFPERFFDVGIAEGHAAVFGAGLSAGGLIPVFAVYSTFLQRAYDNVIHDICLQKLPFVMAIDRAGVLPGDGATHQGIFDIAFLSHIPNICIMAPRDKTELEQMMELAVSLNMPVAVRYPKEAAFDLKDRRDKLGYGKAEIVWDCLNKNNGEHDKSVAIISVGTVIKNVITAGESLRESGVEPLIVNARFVKPFDKEMLDYVGEHYRFVFTIEDGVLTGGFGQQVSEYLSRYRNTCKVTVLAHGDAFPEQGSREELLTLSGMDGECIYNKIMEVINNEW